MKKIFIFLIIALSMISCKKDDASNITGKIGYTQVKWVDLGLPSGTLWAANNENGTYNWVEAMDQFGGSIPTKLQYEELLSNCKWEDDGNGYLLIGKTGSIYMSIGPGLSFWTSTNVDQHSAWYLQGTRGVEIGAMTNRIQVHLVNNTH